MITLNHQLLQLPLFLGMNRDDLSWVVAHTKFGFMKYAEGKPIINEGEVCTRLFFLVKGTVSITTTADDHEYSFTEDTAAPDLLQPECLFGLNQRHTHSYTAKSNCNFIVLGKDEITQLSDQFLIFRLNLLNLISTRLQKLDHRPWRHQQDDLRSRLIRFFQDHCLRPAGCKDVSIRMTTLARELNDSRLDVSRALHALQDEGLLTLRRSGIHIPALEKLILT